MAKTKAPDNRIFLKGFIISSRIGPLYPMKVWEVLGAISWGK